MADHPDQVKRKVAAQINENFNKLWCIVLHLPLYNYILITNLNWKLFIDSYIEIYKQHAAELKIIEHKD